MAVGQFFFAYCGAEDEFNAGAHNVEDEDVFAFRYVHSEGDFAQLEIDIRNPRVGLLNVGRPQWAFLSVETSGGIVPIIKGRIVGIPTNVFAEVVTITFIARPHDYMAQKLALAETLREAPFWDPIFIAPDKLDDPDVVLESRTALWHVDPVEHTLTISDILVGEDGTIVKNEADYLSDDMSLTLNQSPATTVVVKGSVSWDQTFKSRFPHVNLISFIRPWGSKLFETFTLNGLISSWPKVGQQYGKYYVIESELIDVSYTVWPPMTPPDTFYNPGQEDEWGPWMRVAPLPVALSKGSLVFLPKVSFSGSVTVTDEAVTPSGTLTIEQVFAIKGWGDGKFKVGFDTTRKYTENVTITIKTSIQPIVTEPGDDERIELSINGNALSDVIGDEVPIGDLASRRFFAQERGQAAIRYLLCCARAALLIKSRAVEIEFVIPFMDAMLDEFTLRKNVMLVNPRLPGGQAIGKIISIEHSLSGDEGLALTRVRIACCIGKGESPYEESEGEPTYGSLDYMGGDYQQMINVVKLIDPLVTDLAFTVDPYTPNDDGLDPRSVSARDLVIAAGLQNDAAAQLVALAPYLNTIVDTQQLTHVLQEYYTYITIELRNLDTGPFETDINVTVDDLVIPKQIDLEAASI